MTNSTTSHPSVIVMRTIYLALIAGLIFFSALVLYINELKFTFKFDQSDPLMIATINMAAVCIPAGYFYSKSYWRKVDAGEPLPKKLFLYQTGLIIRLAFFEGVGLLSIIGFLLTGNLFYSIIMGISLLSMAYNYPSADSIGRTMNLTDSEIEMLKNSNSRY